MDSGVRIVTRGGIWLQGRRHVIDAITGRSQHTKLGNNESDIKDSGHIHHNDFYFLRPRQL